MKSILAAQHLVKLLTFLAAMPAGLRPPANRTLEGISVSPLMLHVSWAQAGTDLLDCMWMVLQVLVAEQ